MQYIMNQQRHRNISPANIAWGVLAVLAITCAYIIIDHYDIIIAGLK